MNQRSWFWSGRSRIEKAAKYFWTVIAKNLLCRIWRRRTRSYYRSPPGNRIVRIERPEFTPFEAEVVAKIGESTDVAVTFRKVEPPPQDPDLVQNPDPNRKPEPSAPLEPEGMESTPPPPPSDAASTASADPPPQVAPTRPEGVPSLHPIPTSDEQALVLARVDEAFKVEEADTREKKVELAQKLLAMSEEARSTPLDQFGILQRGQRLAVAAEDVPLAMKFVAAKGEAFEIDLLAEQAAVLTQIADSAIETNVIDSLVAEGWKVLDAAVAAHRYDVVGDVINAFRAEIRRKPWQSHAKRIIDRHEELTALLKQWQSVQDALASLEANPEDPTGNALVGRWYLDVGEPEKAFPYMAKIQNEAISSLAKSELMPPELAESQVALGDRWWDQAEDATDSALEKAFRARAVHWYARARPNLNSVVMIERISNRLGDVVAPSSGVASESTPGLLPEGKAIPKGKWEDLLAAIDPPARCNARPVAASGPDDCVGGSLQHADVSRGGSRRLRIGVPVLSCRWFATRPECHDSRSVPGPAISFSRTIIARTF